VIGGRPRASDGMGQCHSDGCGKQARASIGKVSVGIGGVALSLAVALVCVDVCVCVCVCARAHGDTPHSPTQKTHPPPHTERARAM
jgi:hypothetical protein